MRFHAALLLLFFTAAAPAAPAVHEYRLDNGFQVVVKPDRRAPAVAAQVWYRVGSRHEHDGITGLSHMLEHMMFKGTPAHPGGAFFRLITRRGGDANAFTARDFTAYIESLPSDALELALELEADRMVNLAFSEKGLRRERQVLMEERRLRTEDQPRSMTSEHLWAAAFVLGPYRHPVGGWMDDIEHYTLADLRAWYERWYRPDNATLIVVGDAEPARVRMLAERHFGPLAQRPAEPLKPRAEPPQRGERRVRVKAPAEIPYVLMGYKAPSLASTELPGEAYALEVLAGVLDAGDSARLARHLVRGRAIAASAGARYDLYAARETLLLVDGTPAEGETVAGLEDALREELARLRADLVPEDELERVKAQLVAADVYARDSIEHQAFELGMLESVGLGWETGEAYAERVRAVTAEQVRAVARKYLSDERLTVAVLEPQPGAAPAEREVEAEGPVPSAIR